jgi:hypothetical protein
MAVLVVFESRNPMFGPGHDAGGVDHGLLVGAESALDLAPFGPTGSAQAPERSEAV